MRSLPVCKPGALLFLRAAAMQGVSPAWLYSKEPRTEASGLAPDDPAVTHGDVSISVGDTTCQQKADGKMKGIQKERLSDSLKFIRVTEGGRTTMREVLLWGFLSNFNLHSTFSSSSLSLPSRLSLSFCLPVFAWINLSVRVSMPVCLPAWQFAVLSAHHLLLHLQPCPRPLSPPMMWTSTSRPPLTTRSTVASRGPRSSWRSGTAIAWRGWVTRWNPSTTAT